MNKWLFRFTIGPLDPSMFKQAPVKEEPAKMFDTPLTKENTVIPVVFGTVNIDAPTLTWWGDVHIRKEKVNSKGKK